MVGGAGGTINLALEFLSVRERNEEQRRIRETMKEGTTTSEHLRRKGHQIQETYELIEKQKQKRMTIVRQEKKNKIRTRKLN